MGSRIDVERAMDVPGRLAFGVTDLTAAWPHSGTGMGFVDKVFVDWSAPVYPVTAMEYGGEVVEEIALAENVILECVLRDDDPDAIGKNALNTSAGSPSGFKILEAGGTNRAGYFYTARQSVVVFTPQSVIDGEDDQHDMVVFYNALPRMAESQRIAHHANTERQYALSFRATRDSSNRLVQIGRRSDLSLA